MFGRVNFAVLALLALAACDRPCKKGFQPYGDKCVPSPVKDAGLDSVTATDAGERAEMEPDAARQAPEPMVDSSVAMDPSAPSDAGTPDATTPDAGPPDPGPLCYLDKDGDGVGAGELRPCSDVVDLGTLVTVDGDCDDDNAQRSPSLTDICGDAIDNDCDGKVDDESNNACGGPCAAQLGHQPGETCNNGLLGGCGRSGEYVCNGTSAVVCNAPSIPPSDELCGDNIDNDCDGYVNEIGAVNGQIWYRDCDGDGYAVSTIGFLKACTKPSAEAACSGGWTLKEPTGTDIDCNGSNAAYHPGAAFGRPPAGSTDPDLNCDKVLEKDPTYLYVDSSFFSGDFPICAGASDCNCKRWDASGGPACNTLGNIWHRNPADGTCKETFNTIYEKGIQRCR